MSTDEEQPFQNGGINFHSTDYETGLQSPRRPMRPGSKRDRIRKLEDSTLNILTAMSKSIEKNELRLRDTEQKDILKREWQQMALVFDRLLLIIFILLTVGVTGGILVRGTTNSFRM